MKKITCFYTFWLKHTCELKKNFIWLDLRDYNNTLIWLSKCLGIELTESYSWLSFTMELLNWLWLEYPRHYSNSAKNKKLWPSYNFLLKLSITFLIQKFYSFKFYDCISYFYIFTISTYLSFYTFDMHNIFQLKRINAPLS